jgi:putative hydrolase of HD superfamily
MEDVTRQGDMERVLEFLNKTARLKKILRYKEHEEILRESCSDHSWRLAFMSIILAKELNLDINMDRTVKMAIIHDIAESVNDDISALVLHNNESLVEKKRLKEERTMKEFESMLPETSSKELMGLWNEFNKGETPESLFIKALDRIEAVMHTMEMGRGKMKKYNDFAIMRLDSVARMFPQLKGFTQMLKEDWRRKVMLDEV